MTGLVASPTHPRESLDASANATVEHPASQTLEPRNNPRQLRTYGPGERSPRHAPHHREEYGQIEYGGLPVAVWLTRIVR
jgi:hypothetical protein